MSRRLAGVAAALALVAAGAPAPAAAQDSSAAAAAAHLSPAEAGGFGKQIERALASRGARVALVFRAGRPRADMPEGFAYTHGALWVHRQVQAADGRTLDGYAVYNLYHGDGVSRPRSTSYLAQDWPTDFTAGAQADDVGVIVPTPEMQRRLLAVIDSPTYAALHNPSYSLVAHPWAGERQNCNTFLLAVVAAAAWDSAEPRQINANLRTHFRPSPVKAGLLMRIFAPMVDERLAVDDQDGPIVTAGYESIRDFMIEHRLAAEALVLERA
jgi:hypothetical protein